MSLKSKFSIIGTFSLLVVWLHGQCEDFGPGYGEEWLYFFYDNGTRLFMNFSLIPKTTDNMMFGDAYFHLYTRNNIDSPETLVIPTNEAFLQSDFFNKSNDIKVLTHGWLSNDQVNWVQSVKDSLLKELDLNVITVDWGGLAKNNFYPWAAISTRYVGKRVAKLLRVIEKIYCIDNKRIHLIGHSLGAQVMGYAGMFLEGNVYRITGLDPARPLFELPKMPTEFCLDASDGMFVDIIHTAGGTYGYKDSYGDADFFPNKGTEEQPGCKKYTACSHGRACVFFNESVFYTSETGFLSHPCESWDRFESGACNGPPISMGYPADRTARGNFYLTTRNSSLFAKNN